MQKHKLILFITLVLGLISCNTEEIIESKSEHRNTLFTVKVSGSMAESFTDEEFKFATPVAGKLSAILPFYPQPEANEKRFIISLYAYTYTDSISDQKSMSLKLEMDNTDIKEGTVIPICAGSYNSDSFIGWFYYDTNKKVDGTENYQIDGFKFLEGNVSIVRYYPGNPGLIRGVITAKGIRSSGAKVTKNETGHHVMDYSNNGDNINIQAEFSIPVLTVDTQKW